MRNCFLICRIVFFSLQSREFNRIMVLKAQPRRSCRRRAPGLSHTKREINFSGEGFLFFVVCYPCSISVKQSLFCNGKSVRQKTAHLYHCHFHFGNLICRKAAVDGCFISPRYNQSGGEPAESSGADGKGTAGPARKKRKGGNYKHQTLICSQLIAWEKPPLRVFPKRRPVCHFPNKSLCVPVRVSANTRTSLSMR